MYSMIAVNGKRPYVKQEVTRRIECTIRHPSTYKVVAKNAEIEPMFVKEKHSMKI